MFDFPERALSFESKFGYAVGYAAAYIYTYPAFVILMLCLVLAGLAGITAYSKRRDRMKSAPYHLAFCIFSALAVTMGFFGAWA